MSSCSNINFPLDIHPIFAPEESLEHFKDSFLKKIETVDSEESYLEYCRSGNDQMLTNEFVVLYVSYLKGSIDYAREFIEEAFQKTYNKYYESIYESSQTKYEAIKSNNFTLSPFSTGYHLEEADIQRYKQGISSSVYARNEAERLLNCCKKVRFVVAQQFLSNGSNDFSSILKYKEMKSEELRRIIKEEYDLDF